MKKHETKITADHFEAVLVRYMPEDSDFGVPGTANEVTPENYLMIGPPGGPLARISGGDIAIVGTLLQFAESSPFMRRMLPRGGVGPV